MTTFDEEMMKRALREAADEFAISNGAVERILNEARDAATPDDSPRIRAFIQRTGRVQSGFMAAAAFVVVLAVAVPLFIAESNSNLKHAPEFQALAAPRSEKTVTHGAPNEALTGTTGTGFIAGNAQTVSGSTTPLSFGPAKTVKDANAASSDSSLRVEEVGTIRLTVGANKFESSLSQLTDFATTDGGFVASTQSHMGSKARHTYSTGSIVLQVPEHNFTMLVDQVRHSGVATSVVTSANDVTSQYVDLQARISALKVSRAQYLRIMTRTNSINGILAVQNQLDNIQSQIEQLQGQLNLLNSETTYATLTVSLTEAGHLVNPPTHPATGVDKAWHESLHGFAAGVEWLIRIAGPLLFALLLLTVLVVFGRWTWRATERRRGGIS